jgi:hypothetical protein
MKNKNEVIEEDEKKVQGILSVVFSVIGGLMFFMPYFGILFSIASIILAGMTKVSTLKTLGLTFGIMGLLANIFTGIVLVFVLMMGL